MLRLMIGTGVLLMVVGFGAAGWQYWQGLPDPAATAEATPPQADLPQGWLISATGAPVSQDVLQAYLAQDRFVASRRVVITRTAQLGDLLTEGETLPETPYLQVLSDIRAPLLAEGLCDVLTPAVGASCAVNAARVVDGSVNPAQGTAQFRLELVYGQASDAEPLPDLALHVLKTATVSLPPEAVVLLPDQSPETAISALIDAARLACAAEDGRQACRVLRMTLDLSASRPGAARVVALAEIAWLAPLPDGFFAAPPLEPAPEG